MTFKEAVAHITRMAHPSPVTPTTNAEGDVWHVDLWSKPDGSWTFAIEVLAKKDDVFDDEEGTVDASPE